MSRSLIQILAATSAALTLIWLMVVAISAVTDTINKRPPRYSVRHMLIYTTAVAVAITLALMLFQHRL